MPRISTRQVLESAIYLSESTQEGRDGEPGDKAKPAGMTLTRVEGTVGEVHHAAADPPSKIRRQGCRAVYHLCRGGCSGSYGTIEVMYFAYFSRWQRGVLDQVLP